MSIEKEGRSTPDFWTRLKLRLSIASFTASSYIRHPHGTPSSNRSLSENHNIYLDHFLLNERRWPTQDHESFAMGSLVYACKSQADLLKIERLKTKRVALSFKELEILGAVPMSLVMLDFDCLNTNENLVTIGAVLEKNDISGWSIYDSGNSFHLIFDKLVEIDDLPKYYGNLIQLFAEVEPTAVRIDYFTKIGQKLADFASNDDEIRRQSERLIKDISHFDDPDPKAISFIIDLRWIAHSLLEYLKFKETKTGSFAYLRTNSPPDRKSEPQLRWISRVHKTSNGRFISTSLDD